MTHRHHRAVAALAAIVAAGLALACAPQPEPVDRAGYLTAVDMFADCITAAGLGINVAAPAGELAEIEIMLEVEPVPPGAKACQAEFAPIEKRHERFLEDAAG